MKNVLPNSKQFDQIIEQLSRIAKTKPQEDFTNSPGSKVLVAGTKEAGFFGFVQPHEFGKIEGNEEPNDEFNGDNLSLAIGLSSGTAQHSNTPWMKFSHKGKILFVPLKPIRSNLSWDSIYQAGAVYGTNDEGILPPTGRVGTELFIEAGDNSINTVNGHFLGDKTGGMDNYDTVGAVGDKLVLKGWSNSANNGEFTILSITDKKILLDVTGTLISEEGNRKTKMYNKIKVVKQDSNVTIDGLSYKVRLLRGADNDPMDSYSASDRDAVGLNSEWNNLILPLHEKAKTGSFAYPAYAGNVPDWGVGLTDENLITHHLYGSGSYTWCQESRDDNQTLRRVVRGDVGVSVSYASLSWHVYGGHGFRPVLELR